MYRVARGLPNFEVPFFTDPHGKDRIIWGPIRGLPFMEAAFFTCIYICICVDMGDTIQTASAVEP